MKDLEKIITSFGVQEQLNPEIWVNPDDASNSHMKLEIRDQLEEIAEEFIKFVNVDFFIPEVADGNLPDAVGNTTMEYKITIQPGLDANGHPINYHGAPNNSLGTIPYQEIEANNDYGYITQIYDTEDL